MASAITPTPPAPAAPPVGSAAEAAGDRPPGEEAGVKRHQMTQILGIDISPARCHAHMKANLMTPEQASLLEEKRAAVAQAKARGAGAEELDSLRNQIAEINSGGVRIGGDAAIAMATIINVVAQEILRYSMDRTIEADRKMVEVSALHSGELDRLGVWPLIRVLPSIAAYDPDYERTLKADRAMANRAAKKVREDARSARAEGDEGGERPRGDEEGGDLEDENGEVSTTFNTYIDNVTKTVKAEEPYKAMRVSNRLREIISHASAELVGSLTQVAKVAVLDLLRVRTMTAAHLKYLAKMLYVHNGGHGVEPGGPGEAKKQKELDHLLREIEVKVERYRAYNRLESTRKAEDQPAANGNGHDEKPSKAGGEKRAARPDAKAGP